MYKCPLVGSRVGWVCGKLGQHPDTAKDIEPEKLSDQEIVERYRGKELSTKEKIMEFFSSHPNIAERLQALE